MKEIELNFEGIDELKKMHKLLKKNFGFPKFYGKNSHALIDCLSSLKKPEDEMSKVTLKPDETLIIKMKNVNQNSKKAVTVFITAIGDVNEREIKKGNSPSIMLVPIGDD